MLMEYLVLPFKPLKWAFDLIRLPRQIKGPTDPFQSSQDMVQKRVKEHVGTSERNSKRARGLDNERHESRTTTHKHGREGQSDLRSKQAKHFEDLENSRRKLEEAHQGVLTELQETNTKFKNQQQEINFLKEKLRDTSALLDARNQELKVAKTFLSKEDPFSISDVVQTIRDLNSEVMQTAALLADNLTLKRVRNYLTTEIPEGPYKSVFLTLAGTGNEVDTNLLELALQGFLIVRVFWIANAWGFCQTAGWCDGLYSKVRENEDPVVASNWRTLTRRTLSSIDSSREELPHLVARDAIEQLALLLSICGVGEPYSNAQSISKYSAEKFLSLFAAARKLNKMIGENIVSHDLEVAIVGGGYSFNSEHMEDAYPSGGARFGRHTVICTTGLGLCEKTSKWERMLLKPKVVLSA